MEVISRAQFLRGDWGGGGAAIYPPWARDIHRFTVACDGCGECVKACPQHILDLSSRRLPVVDFSHGACTFCGECAAACPSGALHRENSAGQQPWQVVAAISGQCLAMNGTTCLRCIESCPTEAIVARPALRGQVRMHVEEVDCNGCGACFAGCPVNAISIQLANSTRSSNQDSTGETHEPFVHQ